VALRRFVNRKGTFGDDRALHAGEHEISEIFGLPVISADMPTNAVVHERERHYLTFLLAARHRVVNQPDRQVAVHRSSDRSEDVHRWLAEDSRNLTSK